MAIDIDVKGYEMVGDDCITGDSLKKYPPDLVIPYNKYPVGVNSGGYDCCLVVWVDNAGKIRTGIIRVIPRS